MWGTFWLAFLPQWCEWHLTVGNYLNNPPYIYLFGTTRWFLQCWCLTLIQVFPSLHRHHPSWQLTLSSPWKQSSSSLASGQPFQLVPSQRRTGLTQVMLSEHAHLPAAVQFHSRQCSTCSSLLSRQWSFPSHTYLALIHLLLLHFQCVDVQFHWVHNSARSSDLSPHSFCVLVRELSFFLPCPHSACAKFLVSPLTWKNVGPPLPLPKKLWPSV